MNRKTGLILFSLVVVIQLGVLAKMIWDSERVITTGTSYLFELQPVDPNDPFRGKYMTLRFEQSEFKTDTCQVNAGYQDAFILIKKGADGFAKIHSIELQKPSADLDYFKANVYCNGIYGKQIKNKAPTISHYSYVIEYPFERYFMNENTIGIAEERVRTAMRDSTQQVYGEVMIKDGQSRLVSVQIDGVPIDGLK